MVRQRKDETREEYKARDRERSRAYYRKNPEAILARAKATRIAQGRGPLYGPPIPQSILYQRRLARYRRFYAEHREEKAQYYQKYSEDHPTLVRASHLKSAIKHGRGPIHGPPISCIGPIHGPTPLTDPMYGPPLPWALRYKRHAKDMRARHWVGGGIHEPEIRTVVDEYLVLRDLLRGKAAD